MQFLEAATKRTNYKDLEKTHKSALDNAMLQKNSTKVAVAYNNLGYCKYMQVKFDEAVEDYNKAIENDPSMAVAYYNRATISYRMGYFEKAYPDFVKAISLDGENEEFKLGLKSCEMELSSHKN